MMRRFFLLLVMLLTLTIPAWCQNPFNITVTGTGGTAVTTNTASSSVTVQQISGTQVPYKVFDACLSGGNTVVGAGAPYTFTGAICGAGYATSTTVGTVQLTQTGSVTFQVTQQPKGSAGVSTCSGLSDAGTGCQANAGTGASNYAAGNDSRIVNAVPNTRQVAGHALSGDVTLANSDVGLGNVTNDAQAKAATTVCGHALSSNVTCSPSDVGAVPTTTTVNGHALSSNVTVTNADLGAVPTSTTVNGHALSSNVTVTNADLGAVPTTTTVNGHALSSNVTVTNADLGATPTSTTVCGHALSSNVSCTASDVGLGNVPNTDATNASNIATGTLNAARLPALGVPIYSVRLLPVALTSYTIQTGDDKKTITHAPTAAVSVTLPQPASTGSPFIGKTVNAACTAGSTTCTVTRTVTAGSTVVVGVQYENTNSKAMPTLATTDNQGDSFSTEVTALGSAGIVRDELGESHAFVVTGGSTVFTVTCTPSSNACQDASTIWAVYVTEYSSAVSALDGTVQTNVPSAGAVPSVSVTTNFANDVIWLENYSRSGCTSFLADKVPSFNLRDDFNSDSGRCGGIYDSLVPGASIQNIQFSTPSSTWPPQTIGAAFKTSASQTFLAGFSFIYINQGTANITITPTGSTISSQYATGASSLTLLPGQSVLIVSDGANYAANLENAFCMCAAGSNWWGFGVLTPPSTTNGVNFSQTNNQPQMFAFYMPFAGKVSSVTFYVSALASSSAGDIGMYSSTGTLLWHTGSFATTGTGVQTITLGTPVIVNPGLVYFAQCNSVAASPQAYGYNNLGANMANFFGASSPAHSWGTNATDTCTAGVLPNTMTPSNIANSTTSTVGPIQVRLGN